MRICHIFKGLLFGLLVASPSQAANYFTLGLATPFVDWCCNGDGTETTATAVTFGYGWPASHNNIFWEADGSLTISRGEIETFFGSTQTYSVNSLGIYGVWRTDGPVYLSSRAGVTLTNVSGPEGESADGSAFAPSLGVGVGFGEHFLLEFRTVSRDVNRLDVTYRFN